MVEGSPVTGAQPWGTDDDGGQWKGIRQDAVRRIGVRRESDAQSQVPKPKMGTGDARAEQRSGVVANVTHDPMLYKMPFFFRQAHFSPCPHPSLSARGRVTEPRAWGRQTLPGPPSNTGGLWGGGAALDTAGTVLGI